MRPALCLALAAAFIALRPGMDHPSVEPSTPSARIPPRSRAAPTGSEFVRRIWNATGRQREKAVVSELLSGNVPSFLRRLKPVILDHLPQRGPSLTAVVWVTPDYLAIGADEDFVRMPMSFPSAVAVAREFGCALPTRKIVDAIHQQAELRLTPRSMSPGREMTSTAYYWRHNQTIEDQRSGHPLGGLIAGHKKDVILTRRLLTRRHRVAIYGWHEKGGSAIQPLSTIHGARYADYSHGIRLVSTTVLLNGRPKSIFEILSNPDLAPVLTYEGVIRDAQRLLALPSSDDGADSQ